MIELGSLIKHRNKIRHRTQLSGFRRINNGGRRGNVTLHPSLIYLCDLCDHCGEGSLACWKSWRRTRQLTFHTASGSYLGKLPAQTLSDHTNQLQAANQRENESDKLTSEDSSFPSGRTLV